jgi:hypothetical protein
VLASKQCEVQLQLELIAHTKDMTSDQKQFFAITYEKPTKGVALVNMSFYLTPSCKHHPQPWEPNTFCGETGKSSALPEQI